MSNLFDDLARTLAQPMPRRGALRAIGAGLAVAAIPALRPDRAVGHAGRAHQCTGRHQRCFVAIPFGTHEGGCYTREFQQCCKGPNNDPVHPNQMSWVCPKDHTCGEAGLCKCTTKCGDGSCCPRSKGRCVNGTCCPAIRTTHRPGSSGKGVTCCPSGTIAVPGGSGLCCRKGDLDCCDKHDVRKGDDELTPLGPRKGHLCINGKIRKV